LQFEAPGKPGAFLLLLVTPEGSQIEKAEAEAAALSYAVNRRNLLRRKTLHTLRAKLVLLYLDCRTALLKAGDPASGHQLQLTLIVQLGRPTDGEFKSFSREEDLIRGEENTVATDVHSLTSTFFLIRSFTQDLVAYLTFDREPIRTSSLDRSNHSTYRCCLQEH
jgi:hypothetical protein